MRRAATVAVTVVAGLTFAVGCGSDTPPSGNGSTGTTEAAPGSTGTTTDPGASTPSSPDTSGGATTGTGQGGGDGGSGGGGGGGGAAVTACSVLTSADASQALGANVQNTLTSDTECLYEAGANAVMFSLTTEAYDAETVAGLELLPGVEKLSGIGDAAFKVSLGTDTQFHVWIRGKYVAIVVTKESGDTATPARQLLDKILTRV